MIKNKSSDKREIAPSLLIQDKSPVLMRSVSETPISENKKVLAQKLHDMQTQIYSKYVSTWVIKLWINYLNTILYLQFVRI